MTRALDAKGVKLGWFTRSCSDILDPKTGQSAGYDCAGGKPGPIRKGVVTHSNLLDENDQVYINSMARMETLHKRGINIFYDDSYCHSTTYLRDFRKRFGPEVQILPENIVDVNSVFAANLGWFLIGSWNPSFEPINSVLAQMLVPDSSAVVGDVGSSNTTSTTQTLLSSSVNNAIIMNNPKNHTCEWVQLSYGNYRKKASYGSKLGCPAAPRPSIPGCKLFENV